MGILYSKWFLSVRLHSFPVFVCPVCGGVCSRKCVCVNGLRYFCILPKYVVLKNFTTNYHKLNCCIHRKTHTIKHTHIYVEVDNVCVCMYVNPQSVNRIKSVSTSSFGGKTDFVVIHRLRLLSRYQWFVGKCQRSRGLCDNAIFCTIIICDNCDKDVTLFLNSQHF